MINEILNNVYIVNSEEEFHDALFFNMGANTQKKGQWKSAENLLKAVVDKPKSYPSVCSIDGILYAHNGKIYVECLPIQEFLDKFIIDKIQDNFPLVIGCKTINNIEELINFAKSRDEIGENQGKVIRGLMSEILELKKEKQFKLNLVLPSEEDLQYPADLS